MAYAAAGIISWRRGGGNRGRVGELSGGGEVGRGKRIDIQIFSCVLSVFCIVGIGVCFDIIRITSLLH